MNYFDPQHPHEPEIPPHFDADGRCLICLMIFERDNAIRELNLEKKIAQKACLEIAKLERERDEAQYKLEDARQSLEVALEDLSEAKRERDELRVQLKVMQAERDVARISARKSDEAHDRVIGDLERADVMAEKAKELIARWDQPSWKDTAPTLSPSALGRLTRAWSD